MDYYTFGSCRLVAGAYYCGMFTTAQPYKGLTNTIDAPHIATDTPSQLGRVVSNHRMPTPTGTRVWSADNPNELKLQRAANPDYYTHENAGGLGPAYRTNPTNNGMWTETPTATSASGGTGTFNTGYHASQHDKYDWESPRSNYAMRAPGATAATYGGGPHYAAPGGEAGHHQSVQHIYWPDPLRK